MNIKKFFVSLFAAIVVTSVSVFVSCEVGLGPAVDTRPPSIVIEKPEVDKVIRNKFVISGTWEDDGTIDSVYVMLKRTDGKLLDGTSLERKVEATFTIDEEDNEKGTWQAIVDPLEKDNQIIDGSYQATVYIQDKGNHTTSQITTFTIDNTAPVLILSKPNSTPEDQTLSAYGQRLFLEGSIADSTKETWIQLDFYSGEECTDAQYLTTIETEMISPTDVNSNNARLAIYNTDLTQKYATEYYKLYGKTEKSGAEQVYAKITVYDTAETCSEDGEGDALTPSGKIKGNASQSFYLTKKLAESITKSQTANGYGLAPIDIYNVLNGTYVLKNESRTADAQSIKDELLSDEQKKSISVFTINPENSPYFTISGLKTLNLDGKDFEEGNTIVNGTQTLEVSVFMGSDSIALKDDENFYVYLLECDKYGKPIKEDVEANRIKLYSKYKETGSGAEKKIYYKVGGKTDHKTSSGAYVFSIPMNKSLRADPDKGLDGFVNINLEYGKNYIIRVSGKDTEGNDIETTDNGYGFCFTAGGTAPRITITEPADNTVFIKKGDGLHVKGSVTSEGGEPRFTISNEANMVDLPLTPTDEGTWTFEKQIAPDELGFSQDDSVIYSLIFSATRDATESTQTKSVWYDVEGPAITLSDPVPLVKADTVKADGSTVEKDSINGKVTFSGSIIDEFDSRFGSASWKVEQDGAQVTGPGLSGSLEKNFTFQLDTTKLADNKEAVVVISAYDYVGNLSETRYTCYVDQSTDVPKIVTTEEGKDISENADLAFVQQGNNLYQRGGSLVLSITDDDGVANARVKIEEYNDDTYIDPDEKQDILYPSPSFISHVLPTSVGIYRATVTVHDKHYESDSSTQNNYKQIQFFLRVTGTGPDVSITPDKEYINNLAGGKYVLTFKVTNEGNKPYMLKMGTTTILEDVDEDSFTYEITPATTASIKFTVIDKNSSFTEKTFVPRFDSEAPTVSIKNYPNSPSLTEDTTYLFKGDMSDTGNSGIDKVQIKFVDGEQTSTDDIGWTDCTAGSVNWNSELTWANNTVFDTEGKKTVFVKAIDGAGNEATDYKTFTYDKSKPVLTLTNPLSTSETNIVSDEVGASGYVLSGTVTETNALATSNALVIKVDDQSSTITPNATTGEWSYTIAKGTTAGKLKSDASIEVELLAKDIAGKTDNKKYIIYYDTQAPELVVTAPAENEPVSTSSLAIKGTVSDNGYGVENVEYVLYSGNVTSANEASATKIQSDSKDVTSANFPLERKGEQWYMKNPSVNMPLGETEGQLTLKVIATEKTKNGHGGRTKTEYVPFYFDKANPTLTEASIGATGKTKKVGFALSGTASDSNAIESVTINWGTDNSVSFTAAAGATTMNWSQSFVVGSETGTYKIPDGTNEFTIIAKDITGKEKQFTRTVIVDTKDPEISAIDIKSAVGATIGDVPWYKTRGLSVAVTAQDPKAVAPNGEAGTGVSTVEYATSSDGGTNWSSWSPLSPVDDDKYTGTVSFAADGKNLKFKLRATDAAGNTKESTTVKTVNIDTTAPTLTVTQNTNRYVQSGSSVTVTGTYKDEESGVDQLTFKIGDTEITPTTTVTYSTATLTDETYDTTGLDKSQIVSWKAVFKPTTDGKFSVQGKNLAGDLTSEVKPFDITIDSEPPVNTNVKLEELKGSGENTQTKNAYQNTTNSNYYVNNTDKSFKISGVSSDDTGIESVTIEVTNTADSSNKLTPANGGTVGKWNFTIAKDDIKDWTGSATAVVTVKDKSGRETPETFNIEFDVTAPSTVHKIDDSQKNLEFRIGDAPNDAGQEDVGGKYSNGSYGSALTMQLRGNFPDNAGGSGINKFYYRTFNNQEVKIASPENGTDPVVNGTDPVVGTGENAGKIFFKDDAALIAYVVANKTDVFTPLAAVETKNVEYNIGPYEPETWVTVPTASDRFGGSATTTANASGQYKSNKKGYVQFRTSVDTNFKTTMKGFVEGKNYLVIVAEDNAGNLGLDTATVEGVEYPCYSLNVDITAPAIPTKQEEPVFTNLKETNGVVISGTVSDKPNVANGSSGLSKIILTRDGGTGSVEVTDFTDVTAAERTAAGTAYSSDTTLKHWEADVSSLLPSSGMAIISAKVVDNAGFETSTSVATITVDTTGPSLKINSPTANAKVGTSFTISGTVDDGNGAGVDTTAGVELWYKVADGSWTKYGTNPTLTDQNWTCNVNASFVSDGANTSVYFKVKAKDKSGTGNPGESAELAVTVDTKAPDKGTFNVEETADSALGTTWFNSTTVNINGSFTDAGGSGVKKVYYKVNSEIEKSVTSDGSYTINIKNLATGSNTIKVYAEDSVGNKSTATSYTVKVDDKAPTITSGHSGVIYANSDSCLVTLTVEDLGGSTIDKVMLTVGDKAPVECDPSEGNYTKDIKSLLVEGTVSVTASASDKAGNTASKVIANVMLDTTGPTVVINTPAADAKTSNSISVSGSASDGVGSGVNTSKGITLYYTTASSGATTPTSSTITSWTKYAGIQPTLTGSTWSGTFNVPDTVAPDIANTDVYICAVAVDNAGSEGNSGYSTPVKVTVDRMKPVYDATELLIGKKTLAQMTASPWFKDSTLEVKGKFTDDDGSGVTKIFYQVDSNPQVELATSNGSFNTNISGFEANSTLKIWAEDAVGNSTEGDKKSYTIKVDGTAPTITSDISGINYSNGSAVFPVSLTVSDDASGIATVVLSRDGTNTTVSCDLLDGKYKAADISSLLPASGNATIMATATDNAGNTASTVAANILVDKKEPDVILTAPADADTSTDPSEIQVNGTISLSGTSSDENVISRVVGLLYKKADSATKPAKQTDLSASAELSAWTVPEGWTKVAATLSNANATTNWTFNGVDTTKLDGTNTIAENSSIWFTVAVQDTAGNIGYSTPVQVYAKQDTDRPVITLSQLTKNTVTTLKTKNVYGSVTDDDGTLEKLWYWNGATAPTTAPSYNTTWTDLTGWNEITINGGSWSIDSTEDDGQTTWYFAVADAKKTVFATVGTDTLKPPYIKYTDETDKVDGTASGVTFKYDTNPPTVTSLELFRAATGTTTTAEEISTNANIAWSNVSGMAFGGNYDVLYAKVVVEEGTGMMTLEGTAGSAPTKSPVAISYVNKNGVSLNYEHIKAVSSDNGTYTYYLGPLVMNTTEAHDFKVTVQDAVANRGYITRSIKVDNDAPTTISNVKPSKTDTQNGVVNFRGVMSDNADGSGIRYEKDDKGVIIDNNYGVEWYIPTDTQNADNIKTLDEANSIVWRKPTTKGSSSWEIEFENLGTTMDYNSSTYSVSNDYDGYETESGSGLYDIPVWFRLTDEVGNVGYNTENSIRYDPNADRPSVQITYPSHETGKDYVQMGGTITISGMANDDDGISAVYLQFDMDGDGEFENGVNITGCPYATSGNDSVLDTIPDGSSQKGILAHGTKSWYYTINVSQLKGLKYSDSNNKTLNVRAIAIEKDTDKAENDYLYSAWSDTLHISVNNDIPNYSNIKLKRFSTHPTESDLATKVADAEQDYTPDMYIKGSETDWYFTGWVEVSGNVTVDSIESTATGIITASADSGKKMYFAIPISSNSATGSVWTTDLLAKDNTTPPNESPNRGITVRIDDQPPVFPDTKTVGEGENATTEIMLYKGDYGKTDLSTANKVQDSNSWFAFAGKITEGGSGFSRLAFYYERKGAGSDTSDRVYNPMEAHGANNQANRANIVSSAQDGKVYKNSESLPALYVTGATRDEENSITAAVLKDNANVRVGGLIKIGGIYRKIDSIDDRDTDGKITFTPSCSTSYKTAEFIYAMVVDNTGESREGNNIKLDDGDGMVESYQKSGSNYTWDATIASKNIPDGPIEIHCVAFDVAGNNAHGYTTTSVSNNPPRITKVMLGTDLNADSYYNLDKEFKAWYALEGNDTTKGTDKWDLDAKIGSNYWKAKKDLVVIPEFVGGSGTIYYKYSKSAAGITEAETGTLADNEANPPVAATIAALVSSHAKIVTDAAPTTAATLTATADTDNKIGAIVLVNDENDGLGTISTSAGEDGTNVYSFSFWDSTESCTPGSTSQWAVLNATFMQDLVDSTKPTGTITPFYWESLSNNSVYTSKASVNSVEDLEGHIELSGDLPTTTFNSSTAALDLDPKVSGKIKIEGTAQDETILGSITVTFADKSATASYTSSTKTWSYSGSIAGSYALTVTDNEGPTQAGHSVTWTLIADTSIVTTNEAAATEKTIKVSVKDAAPNTSNTSSTQTATGAETAYYKVDIVPYITKISTSLDGAYKNKTSVFNRSALGSYPVRRGEIITISGYNLKKDNDTAPTLSIGTVSASSTTSITASIGTGATVKSGDLDVTVNGVVSLNNKTIKTVEYNQEPNGINNDILTNARKLSVWSFNTVVESTTIRYPTMRVGKDSNQTVGFVYDSVNTVRMNKGTANSDFRVDNSFSQWYNTGIAVDTAGRLYASSQNGDSGSTGEEGFQGNHNQEHANSYFYAWNTKTYPGTVRIAGNYGGYTATDSSTASGRSAYSKGTKKVAIENLYNNSVLTPERVQNQKIAVKTGSSVTDTASVYLVYYDSATAQVRFRYGTVTGNEGENSVTFGGALINHDNENNGSATGYQIIAGTGASGENTISGSSATNTTRAGEYVALGIIPQETEDVAIVSWYDSANTRLLLSYNTNPSSLYTTHKWGDVKGTNPTESAQLYYTDTNLTTHPSSNNWLSTNNRDNRDVYKPTSSQWGENTKIIDSDFAGWYVDMAVDPDGGIHIAYYGASNGDLKYAYLSSYNAEPQVCTVDSYLSVGSNISIDVPTEKETVYKADGTTTTRYVPRISYFMSAFTKTKYSVRTASLHKLGANDVIADGVNNDNFTGNWEVMTVPTDQIPLDYSIGVGLKKNDSNTDSTLLGYGTKEGLQTAALQ